MDPARPWRSLRFLVKEYGFRVSPPTLISATENRQFFDRMDLTSDRIIPITDATALPYTEEF